MIEPPILEQVVLERLKFGLTQRVSAEFAQSVAVNPWRDHILDRWVYAITVQVLADRLPPETVSEGQTFTFEVPASPWQQFKADHAVSWWLRWLVKRRPVRLVKHRFHGELTVRLDRFWMYPKSRISLDFGSHYKTFVVQPEISWAALDEGTTP